MKILIDECVPRKFKFSISAHGHECQTVPEAGLSGKTNGELLAAAELIFAVFITLDKGIEFQQNLLGRRIAILVIRAKSNRFQDVDIHAAACVEALRSIQPGQIVRVG
jgi:predicted nuclease of predicted toxin-antitoxin system